MKFDNHNWKIIATDKYSQKGLIQVYLKEDFDNDMEDKQIEPTIVEVNENSPHIEGPMIVKPYDKNLEYSIKNVSNGAFVVESNKIKVIETDSSSIKLNILSGKSGSFEIKYEVGGDVAASAMIIIESL